MLEKSGIIVLTEEDLEEYNSGSVSERIKSLWNLSFDELRDIVLSNSFTLQQ